MIRLGGGDKKLSDQVWSYRNRNSFKFPDFGFIECVCISERSQRLHGESYRGENINQTLPSRPDEYFGSSSQAQARLLQDAFHVAIKISGNKYCPTAAICTISLTLPPESNFIIVREPSTGDQGAILNNPSTLRNFHINHILHLDGRIDCGQRLVSQQEFRPFVTSLVNHATTLTA